MLMGIIALLTAPQSATEKQIKSHYKKLSLKFHPDKVKPDPSKNETLEDLNSRYVEMTKAYQALTDEEVRNNYIQFGHPDGKQGFSMGISLPKFIVAEGNGKYVVLLYTLLLGVILPYYVGSWWYGWQRMSKDGILMESANNLFRRYEDSIDEAGVVTAVSSGKEFKELFKDDKADAGLAKIESKIWHLIPEKERNKLEQMDDTVQRKTLALLWAYLGRVDLEDPALNRAKFEVAPIAERLVKAFTTMTLAFGNTAPIVASYVASQHFVQGMLPGSSPLLQLPHFTPAVVKAVEQDSKVHTSVQKFMEMPAAERRKMVVGPGLLTGKQFDEAMALAGKIQYFRVAKAFFKVTGERFITPGSLVSLVVKGRFIPPGCENVPEVDPLDLEDVDPPEDDMDANTGRKKKVKGPDGKWTVVEDLQISPNQTFSPYFAREHAPKWYVFLTDSKSGKMAVPPFPFTVFDQAIFDQDGKPTFKMQTLKAQFAAPGGPGHYTFAMHLVCDSYYGMDTKTEATLVVEDASKAQNMTAEDEISEPDEGK
jgi:translocation protein SEC63